MLNYELRFIYCLKHCAVIYLLHAYTPFLMEYYTKLKETKVNWFVLKNNNQMYEIQCDDFFLIVNDERLGWDEPSTSCSAAGYIMFTQNSFMFLLSHKQKHVVTVRQMAEC